MPGLIKTAVASALHWSGMAHLIPAINGPADGPLVLGYHRVVEDFESSSRRTIPAMLISRRTLERQLDWIDRRYRFVSLDELGASLQGEKNFSRPIAAVTFDDGYEDVYRIAFPLLKRKGIPGAVFVVTDLVGTSELQLHDRLFLLLGRAFARRRPAPEELPKYLAALGLKIAEENLGNCASDPSWIVNRLLAALPQSEIRRLIAALESGNALDDDARAMHRTLDWKMLEEMSRAGMTIGSHTKSHAVLTVEKPDKVSQEIEGSRKELERRLGTKIRHFAYPDGRFNDAVVQTVAASGYRFAYTTCRHRLGSPLLTIPRVLLWENSCLDGRGNFSPAILNCQINGIFDLIHSCTQVHSLRQAE